MDLFPGPDKTERAIALLRTHEPEQGYYLCFSGGKDSCVIKQLTIEAGVKFTAHYNMTPDPPELVAFIRKWHADAIFDRSNCGGFFAEMTRRGFPTRKGRWCCQEYKESSPPRGSVLVLGVRAKESSRRAATWKPVTFHRVSKAWAVAPILDWSSKDVWAFIRDRGLPYCSLYDEGFTRLGCVGCPQAGREQKLREFARWPKFEAAWRRAFRRIWDRRRGTGWFGETYFRDCDDLWDWWLGGRPTPTPLTGRTPLLDAADYDESDSCQIALDMLSQ